MKRVPDLDDAGNTRLIATYRRYPDAQRRILQVLSVVYQPVNQSTLQRIVRKLGWCADNGRALADIVAKPWREQLLADGLVTHSQNLLRCHPDVVEVMTREAAAAGLVPDIARAAEAIVPTPRRPYDGYRQDDTVPVRALRTSLYSGRYDAVQSQLGLDDWSYSPQHYERAKTLIRICTHPFDRVWLDGLPVMLRFQVLACLLDEATLTLSGSAHAWQLLEDSFGATPPHPKVALFLAEQRLYRGMPEQAEVLLPNDGSLSHWTLLGWIRFLQGRYAESIQDFQAAIKAERRKSRKRNIYISGLPGVFFVLLLQKSDDASHRKLARRQLATAAKVANNDRFDAVFRLVDDLLSIQAGEMTSERSVWLQRDSLAIEPWLDLFRCLALHWLGVTPRARQMAKLLRCCKAARNAGLWWYAGEATLLLEMVGKAEGCSGGTAPAASASASASAWQPSTDLFRPEAHWQQALRALKGVREGGTERTEPLSSDLRMVWLLSCRQNTGGLAPREQKRTKSGGWSRGRAVALQRLHEQPEAFDYLSPQDRRICQQIQAETVYEYYGHYPKTRYRLDSDQALLAAVGHPLLFSENDREQPLELVQDEPVLEVHRGQDRLHLQLQPYPPAEQDLVPQQEGGRRLRLVAFNAQHRRIAEVLGEAGLDVPLEATDQVLESIAAIAPLLTVHSDVGAGADNAATAVAADPRPHIHLRPQGDGLALECYVRPFGEAGPLFRPGAGRATVFAEIDGKSLQTTRETGAEQANAGQLLEQCPELDPEAEWDWVLDAAESALDTLVRLQELGDAVSLEWPRGQPIRVTRSLGLDRMRISMRGQRDWFGLEGELQLDAQRVLSMKELLQLLEQSPGRFLRLDDGEFLSLTKELRKRLEALRGIGDDGRFHPLATPAIAEITDGMEIKATHSWRDRMARLRTAQELQPQVPSTLQAELRDYQLEGFRWLARLAHWGAGACLADDMGLGKTLQALALILSRASAGPALVLAPTSVCSNWLEETARFAPTLTARRFGPGDRQRMLDATGAFDLIICSYGLLQTESERLAAVTWSTIVADEAQAIKNNLTKRSRAAMALQAEFRMIATGTPIENHLGELWSLFRFINPGLLGSLDHFNRRFATPIEQHRDRATRQRLKQLIRPFVLRRLKSEVLTELPSRTEITLHVELSEQETALYEAMRQQAIEKIQEESLPPGQRRVKVLTEIMQLRRACCNPRLVTPDSPLSSTKLQTFIEIVDELRANRHKALVFSQFVGHLALLREHLDTRRIRYQYLDGATSIEQRRSAVTAFQGGDGDLFLISLKAGGSGLNLTAADYVIHMDPWWNPAVEDQASDRAHRIGQQRPVTIYRLVAKNTIEDKIVQLHAHKRDLADSLLEGSELSGKMSVEEMIGLIREAETA